MKKTKKINIIYVISIIFLSIVSIAYITTQFYNNNIKLISKINNAFYNDEAEYFRVSNNNLNFYDIKSTLSDGTLLYNLLSDEQDIRGIVFKGNIDYPRLNSGRFFDENDFDGKSKLAVIGKDVDTLEIEGECFYDFNGERYKVIGVIGYDFKTRLDRTVFLSMNDKTVFSNIQYVVSAKNSDGNFKLLSNENVYGEVTLVPRSNPGILSITNTGKSVNITTTLFIIVLLFNAFVLIYFLTDKIHDEIVIMKINGISNKNIFKHFFSGFLCLIILSILIGTIISSIIACIKHYFSFSAVFKGDITLFIFFVVVICYSLFNAIEQIKNIKSGGIE